VTVAFKLFTELLHVPYYLLSQTTTKYDSWNFCDHKIILKLFYCKILI